jgi:hypothetical protein
MASVFLSYRREDARADAGRLYDRLSGRLGAQNVFMDIDDITAGENFVEKLKKTLEQCNHLLLVIGPRWLSATDAEGNPRLYSPNDFVRLEVVTALERGITLIPVLVGGARMPERGELPSQLAEVVVHQAIQISDERFHEDVDRLIAAIRRAEHFDDVALWRRPLAWAASLALAIAAVTLGYLLYERQAGPGIPLRTIPAHLTADDAKVMLATHAFYDKQWNGGATGPQHDFATEVSPEGVVIVDRGTGLEWQKQGSGTAMSYEDAEAFVSGLNERRYGGFTDWRLPTLDEAMSLMQPEPEQRFHLDPIFERASAPFVWTADSTPQDRRWVVYYYDGIASPESGQFNAHVRAVRTHGS